MSTKEASVPIHLAHSQSSYQLLELPLDLVSEIKSASDDTKLFLKSVRTVAANVANRTSSTAGNTAVICTKDRTFTVRQAQSSNSLYILAPFPALRQSSTSAELIKATKTGLVSTAQCHSVLELLPAQPNPITYLLQRVPLYDGNEYNYSEFPHSNHEHLTERQLLNDAPFSECEFYKAYRELCIFKVNDLDVSERHRASGDHYVFRPTENAMLKFWDRLSWVQDLSLSSDAGTFLLLRDVDYDLETESSQNAILQAVIRGAGGKMKADGRPVGEGLLPGNFESWKEKMIIDQKMCARWVGRTMLLKAGPQGLPKTEFLEAWRDTLPTCVAKRAFLDDGMGEEDYVEDNGNISFADKSRFEHMPARETADSSPTSYE